MMLQKMPRITIPQTELRKETQVDRSLSKETKEREERQHENTRNLSQEQ